MPGDARDGLEVELAYTLVEPNDLGRYLSADRLGPFRASGGTRSLQVEDRYVDTVDGALARAGFAARLRRGHGGTVLSVKSLASSRGALQQRTELEGPADLSLDAASWPPSTARSLVLELCGDAPLGEIVTIRQVRRRRDLRADATTAELTLDEVEVVSGGSVVSRFSELEVELAEGDEERLRELEASLASDRRLRPSGASKFERALEAIGIIGRRRGSGNRLIGAALEGLVGNGGSGPSPRSGAGRDVAAGGATDRRPPPKGPGVRADDSFPEAGRKVLAFHFGRLLDREPGVREGADPGELKSMRVATRRMRAAWRVFGEAFRSSKTRKLQSRLRDVARRLGATRDLEVLIDDLEEFGDALPDGRGSALEPLLAAWRASRAREREALVRLLDSDEYAAFVDGYREFLDADPASVARRGDAIDPTRVAHTAPSRIWAAAEHVRAFEPLVGFADVATLHQLRIATKRLRYTLEFFREALGPDAASLIERCVAVQDHLGLMNDANVTAGLVREFLSEHDDELSTEQVAEIGGYLASREADVARLRETFAEPWQPLTTAAFRQALGRAVAEL